jgi:hypothetical protein
MFRSRASESLFKAFFNDVLRRVEVIAIEYSDCYQYRHSTRCKPIFISVCDLMACQIVDYSAINCFA